MPPLGYKRLDCSDDCRDHVRYSGRGDRQEATARSTAGSPVSWPPGRNKEEHRKRERAREQAERTETDRAAPGVAHRSPPSGWDEIPPQAAVTALAAQASGNQTARACATSRTTLRSPSNRSSPPSRVRASVRFSTVSTASSSAVGNSPQLSMSVDAFSRAASST